MVYSLMKLLQMMVGFPVPNVSTLDEGTDWQNEFFENATIQRNVYTTGGSETINYSFGASPCVKMVL